MTWEGKISCRRHLLKQFIVLIFSFKIKISGYLIINSSSVYGISFWENKLYTYSFLLIYFCRDLSYNHLTGSFPSWVNSNLQLYVCQIMMPLWTLMTLHSPFPVSYSYYGVNDALWIALLTQKTMMHYR